MNTVTAHIEHGKDGSFGIYTEYGALPLSQLSHYMTGTRRPTATTHNKIKNSIQKFALSLEQAFA